MAASAVVGLDDIDSAPGGSGLQACLKNLCLRQTIREIRRDSAARLDGFHKIHDGVRKLVLVANDVSRRPPVSDIGVYGFCGKDGAEALRIIRGLRRKILKLIHALKVEDQAALIAVDFKGIEILSSGGQTAGLKGPQSAIFKLHHHKSSIFNSNFACSCTRSAACRKSRCAFSWQRTLRDEVGRHRHDALDVANQEACKIDTMRVEITLWARTRRFFFEMLGQGN